MSTTSDESLADLVESKAMEEAARRRAAGIADDERKKRRRLALELVTELRRPLVEHHGPSDIEALAARIVERRK